MAINIQSLFSDIIETPAQKQRRLLEEGLVQASAIQPSSGLVRTGLATDIMRDMPRQREQFRRGVGGMLGLDVRSESEKVQDALKGVDPNDAQSILQAAQAVGNLGLGTQAAQMRAMAADVTRQKQADLMAQQDFAMRQAQAAESIATSIQNRELALTEEQRRKNREVRDQASALLNQQFTSLGIASRLQDIVETENMLQNRERASEVIASFGDEYASFAELAKTSPDPTRLFTQVYEMELEKQSIVPYEMVGDAEFENALAIAKEHPTLGNEFKDGWMSDPNISEQRFRDYYSRLRNSNLGKSQTELIELFARQNEIGVAEQLSRINVESVANQVAGGESEGGVDPEAMAGAAAALAESDETVSAELTMPSPEDYLSDQPQRTGLEASQRTAGLISDVGQTLLQPSPVVVQRQQEQQEIEQARKSAVEAGLRGTDLRRYLDDFRAYQESKRQ
jgi:hypothetical protein